MRVPPLPLWTAAASDAVFTDPAACAARADAFERMIARRNRRNRIAGWVQLPLWGALAGFFAWQGEWAAALSLVLIGAGVLAVIRNVGRHAGDLRRRPEEPCRDHLARHYRRQYAALMRVPAWYIGPLVPGVLAFFGAVTAGVAKAKEWEAALAGLAGPALALGGLMLTVVALNWRVAHTLKRDLDRLDRLA